MSIDDVLKLRLNYLELAYIQDIEVDKAREIFYQLSGRDIVRDYTLASVEVLKAAFSNISSLDARYDGYNELVFNLLNKSENYKKYLSDEHFIITGKLLGGKSVLLKIMSKEQKLHLYSIKKEKYNNLILESIRGFKTNMFE